MDSTTFILLSMAIVFGLYMAWSIGANDVANAMGTSVGSGALTLKKAIILAAIFEFAGAFLVGSQVSETVRKKIFEPERLRVGEPGSRGRKNLRLINSILRKSNYSSAR